MQRLKKALTLSYDDGVESDKKLLGILNKYNIRCTFNLNSGIQTYENCWNNNGFDVHRMDSDNLKQLYAGHEIAIHGTKHLWPSKIEDEAGLKAEFFDDIIAQEDLFDKRMQGMAYAFGDYNDTVVDYLKRIGIKYSRTTKSNHSFDLQSDLLRFEPTCHHNDEKLMDLANKFIESDSDKPQIFYLWGHSYEFDVNNNWEVIEEFCKFMANRDDVFYGTNTEVFEYFNLI